MEEESLKDFIFGEGVRWIWKVWKIQLTSIKFNMSLKTVQTPIARRTSERRRLKMLRNLDQYKISNPFKSVRQVTAIPDDLAQQLKKVDYLSATSISLISFPAAPQQPLNHQSNLNKMRDAILNQLHRMQEVIGEAETIEPLNPEAMEEEEVSLGLRAGHCAGEEVITTREQLSMNFMNFHESCFPPQDFQEENLDMLQSRPRSEIFRHANAGQEDHLIIDEEYERYFAN